MDTNPADETSHTTQYQEAVLQYLENEYCAKHRRLLVTMSENTPNNNLSSSAMAFRPGRAPYDPYDLSSDDDEYFMPNTVAKMTRGRSDHAAHLLTSAGLYLNSPPELPLNWG
jgi:hypothetical protein